jgi:ABC-type transport system involved in multi-copper enzyme maturation permease subunit
MSSTSIQSEFLKIRKRPLTLWVIGILLVVVLLYPPFTVGVSDFLVIDTSQGLAIWAGPLPEEAKIAAQKMREAVIFPNVIFTIIGVAAGLGKLLMVVFGASQAGNEFSWGTARHLISRTRDRLGFVSGKLVVIVGLIVFLLSAGLVIGAISGTGITPAVRDGIDWGFISPELIYQIPLAILIATLSVLPYALLGFTIALITRSTATGLSIGLVTLLIGEPVLAQILASFPEPWSELFYYLPYGSNQVIKAWMNSIIGGTPPDQIVRAVAVLVGHILAWAGLALASFRRRELTE